MYKHYPSLVLGFHACEREIGEKILSGKTTLKASKNEYDWLGNGIYFWENSLERATAYGQELKNERNKLKDPMVIGAVIHLGYCFNLLDSNALKVLKGYYDGLEKTFSAANLQIPVNKNSFGGDKDKLLRSLDCAVFQYMHNEMKNPKNEIDGKSFDSIRGVFWEGKELYPTAGFKEKNHIQLCICNTNCIKGYFRPLEMDKTNPRV